MSLYYQVKLIQFHTFHDYEMSSHFIHNTMLYHLSQDGREAQIAMIDTQARVPAPPPYSKVVQGPGAAWPAENQGPSAVQPTTKTACSITTEVHIV